MASRRARCRSRLGSRSLGLFGEFAHLGFHQMHELHVSHSDSFR